MSAPSGPRHFRTAAEFRRWLEKNHATTPELIVAFYKKASGKGGMTYPEALDEALCWGWIDGVRRSLGDDVYVQRFTPRKAKSKWSEVNLRHYARLEAEGRIAPPGAAAYARFDPAEHTPYSFEARPEAFHPELEAAFQAEPEAWAFFQEQPPGYRRIAMHFVMSAKREETRRRRLTQLIEASRDRERLPQIAIGTKRGEKRA